MPVKTLDERHKTKKGQIRLERWEDAGGQVVRYNLAYINTGICALDNGRVFGFDDAHLYKNFSSKHHMHWFGQPVQGKPFVSFDETLRRFERMLRFFKSRYKNLY